MKKILIATAFTEGGNQDTHEIGIAFPQTLGNPLRVNERWSVEYIQEMYSKYLLQKLNQKNELFILKLDYIAGLVMGGKQVILIQDPVDVHGQLLADFIEAQIHAAG